MKKWKNWIRTAILLFTVLFPVTAMAKDTGEVTLKKEGDSKATVSLTVEDRIAQDITSLRLQLFVEVEKGEIAPFDGDGNVKSTFAFSDEIKGQVRDWKAFPAENGEYIVDLVISGTENIFGGTASKGTVTIGTLTLAGAQGADSFSAEVGLYSDKSETDEETSGTSVIEYVEKEGNQSLMLSITNAKSVLLGGEETEPESPKPGETESEKPKPGETESENPNPENPNPGETNPENPNPGETESENPNPGETNPENPNPGETESENTNPEETNPANPNPGETESENPNPGDSGDDAKPGETENPPDVNPPDVVPPEETDPFDQEAAPELEVSCPLSGSGYVRLDWTKIKGADGYEIRRVKSGSKKLIAVVEGRNVTTFEKAFKYNTKYKFKVRAFKLDDDDEKVYGRYSESVEIRTPKKTLGKMGAITAEALTGSKKITLRWTNLANAEGYRIFMKNETTGEFETIRTIDGTAADSYTTTKQFGKTYTFRIAAYKYDENKEPALFGNYSDSVSVTTGPARVTGVALESKKKGQTAITWKKVARAQGYQIYRSTQENSGYKNVKVIKKAGRLDYTDKKAKSKTHYYYWVRAFVTAPDGTRVNGAWSDPQEITVK